MLSPFIMVHLEDEVQVVICPRVHLSNWMSFSLFDNCQDFYSSCRMLMKSNLYCNRVCVVDGAVTVMVSRITGKNLIVTEN